MADAATLPSPSDDLSPTPTVSKILTQAGISPQMQGDETRSLAQMHGVTKDALAMLKQNSQRASSILDQPLPKMPDAPDLADVPAPPKPLTSNPMRVFGELLPVIAMLGGAFSKNSATATLRVGSSAMEAAKANDATALQKAHDEWKDNLDYITKYNEQKTSQYKDILENRKMDMDDRLAQLQALAASDNNMLAQQRIAAGDLEGLYKDNEMRANVTTRIKELTLEQEKVNLERARLATITGGGKGSPGGDLMAWTLIKTGSLPPNMGRNGTQAAAARERAMEILQSEKGMTPEQAATYLATRGAAYTANKHSLLPLDQRRALMEPAEEATKRELGYVEQAGKKLASKETFSPLINQPLNVVYKHMAGDPDFSAFQTYVNSAASEYARVISGALGSAASTDSSRSEASQLMNPTMSFKQIMANIDAMNKGMDAKNQALNDEYEQRLNGITGESFGDVGDAEPGVPNGGSSGGAPSVSPPPFDAGDPKNRGQYAHNGSATFHSVNRGGTWVWEPYP